MVPSVPEEELLHPFETILSAVRAPAESLKILNIMLSAAYQPLSIITQLRIKTAEVNARE